MFKNKFVRNSQEKSSLISSVKMNRATVLNSRFKSIKTTHNTRAFTAISDSRSPVRVHPILTPKAIPKKLISDKQLDHSCLMASPTMDPLGDFKLETSKNEKIRFNIENVHQRL